MRDSHRRVAVATTAVLLAGLGLTLLFAGDALGGQLFAISDPGALTSLLGVAHVGFGMINWIAKGSILGGIYGRAIVVGNQVHFFGGTLVLLASGDISRDTPVFWAVAAVYIWGMALFTYLMRSSGVR
jgi:hypothetical protein